MIDKLSRPAWPGILRALFRIGGIGHPSMQQPEPPPGDDLKSAMWDIVLRPVRTLVPPWSWKAAALSAIFRGVAFFVTNLGSGRQRAVRAMVVEAVFAIFAAGLLGAVSQRLRGSQPVWATAMVVALVLPGFMVLAQLGVHRVANTPHIGSGVVASFCLASFASAFSWYAMRYGAMLGGNEGTSLGHDLRNLPGISVRFLVAGPRMLFGIFGVRDGD